MKALVARSHDRILGFTMIGPDAGEVLATVPTAMLAELPHPTLRDAIRVLMSWFMIIAQRPSRSPSHESPTTDRRRNHQTLR
jgi:hypothetical protein